MKKREIPVMNVGISLIILIFMNICLAAFAVLSLENAVSDYSLSKKTAKHTTQYYEAVNNVQEQLAKKNQELREKAETKTTEAKSSQKKAEIKTLVIGCEGGFSKNEREKFNKDLKRNSMSLFKNNPHNKKFN